MVIGEHFRLSFLISRLLRNARYRGDGLESPVVKVSFTDTIFGDDEKEGHIIVAIRDNGPLMSREEMKTIMKPLETTRQAPIDKCNISDVRMIAKAIRADLTVTTEMNYEKCYGHLGFGSLTVFTLVLPVHIVPSNDRSLLL